MQKQRSKRRTQTLREFLRYVIPNVFGMLGISLYILADTFFIAKGLGADGLTALNLAVPAYSLISGIGMMFAIGSAARYSILRASGKKEECGIVFSNAFYAVLAAALGFVLAGIFFSEELSRLLGADSRVYEMTKTYLQVILLFAPAFLLNTLLNCYVRNDGEPGLAMLAMLSGSLANIVMDYIFIFPLRLGILGAVLATGFSPLLGMLLLGRHVLSKRCGFRLVFRWPEPARLLEFSALGSSSLISELSGGIVMVLFNMLILGLMGNTGVAAYGVIANLSIVLLALFSGVAQGIQPLLGAAFGRGEKQQERHLLLYALVFVLLGGLLACLGSLFFAAELTSLFNNEGNTLLQRTAERGIRLFFLSAPFAGVNIVMSMYFTAVASALPAQLIALSRAVLLLVPAALLLSFLFGMTGVWLSVPLTELLVSFSAILFYFFGFRKEGSGV